MKTMKKLVAILLAAVMVMSLCGVAFAVDETPAYDAKVSVTGLAKDDVAHFYKIIEWVGEAEGNVSGWKATEAFASILPHDTLQAVLVGSKAATQEDVTAGKATQVGQLIEPTGITAALAGQLARAASGDGTIVTVTESSAELTVDKAGTYMVLTTPADANTTYNPVFVSSDYTAGNNSHAVSDAASYSDKAAAKKSTVNVEKTATTTEDAWDDNKASTTAVGDTVAFTVKATVPGYAGVYDHPHFVLTDTLNALKLDASSVTVKAGETPLTAGADKDYTITTTDTSYTITFTETYLKSHVAATEVTVTYNATVTTNAQYAVNQEKNEVQIEYSHNPNQETDYDVKKDSTQHYTFSLDAEGAGSGDTVKGKKTSEIVKIGLNADGTPITDKTETSVITSTEKWTSPLAGAVFGLFTDAAGTVPYKAKNPDGTAGDTALTATTGADGRMSFSGLDAGTYYLKEISAPAGYVTNSTPVKVVITAEVEEVEVTEEIGGKTVTYKTDVLKSYSVTVGENTSTYTFTNDKSPDSNDIQWDVVEMTEHPHQFTNTKGIELPTTGGIGTTIFYISGIVLVLGAAAILVARRKAEQE